VVLVADPLEPQRKILFVVVPFASDVAFNLYVYGSDNPLAFVDASGLYAFGFGPNLGGGAGQDYDPESIPFNSAVNSITAGPGSVQRNYGVFDLVVDGALVAGTAGTGVGVYSAAVTYGPTVVAAGASAIAAGQNALYRVMATQPGNVLNQVILYYPQSAPARATTAELISSATPYVAQFVSGALPGPGGPYANKGEVASWFAGRRAGQAFEAATSPSPGSPAASTPRVTSSAGGYAPAVPK